MAVRSRGKSVKRRREGRRRWRRRKSREEEYREDIFRGGRGESLSLAARGMTHLLPADRRMDGGKRGGDGLSQGKKGSRKRVRT